jgi:hypothetical protein
LPGTGKGENAKLLFNGHGLSFGEDEKVLKTRVIIAA